MDINDQRELLKDLVKHPGSHVFVDLIEQIITKTEAKQLTLDPYKNPDEIMRCKQLIFLLKEELPKITESIINYDSAAIDKMVAPKKRWYFWKFFKKLY